MTEEADPPATTAPAAEDTGSTALSGVEGATQQPPTATSPPAASAAIGVSTTITADTATTSTSLSATAAASATVAAPIGDSDGSNSHECFLCCDEDSGLGRTYNVCRCHGMYVHIACQQKMLDAAVAMRGGPRLRCGACHGRYKNAKVLPTWRLSIIGALWCTCLVGVAVMWWSATTVLDRGSSYDPKLRLTSPRWWTFSLHHLTWWRLIGLAYLVIAVLMGVFAGGWAFLDLCGARLFGWTLHEPLCVTHYTVHVWEPDDEGAGGGGRGSGGWRGSALRHCFGRFASDEDDREPVTVLL